MLFQDSNPFLKENLQRSEDLAFWFKQKTEDFVITTNLTGPLKRIDNAAANGLDQLEKARLKVGFKTKINVQKLSNKYVYRLRY